MNDEHTLEFLLSFNGRVHCYEQGYWVKFEIRRVEPSEQRPHGLAYAFTLHGPSGRRIMGFDNAHGVGKSQRASDHWHRTEGDPGRPYAFTDAATLIGDFFDEVERVLTERGVPCTVIDTGEKVRKT